MTNNSTLTCNPLVVGGVTQPGGLLVGGNATGVDTTLCPLTQNVPPIADPFGTISPYFMTSIPTIAAGTSPTGAITPVSASNPNGLKPVALPGGINQTSSASITKICPGIYVIDGAPPANGQFKVTGGTVKSLTSNVALTASYDPLFSVDCPGDSGGGVAFVLTSSGSTSKIPNVQISGATTVIDLNGIDSTQSGNSELPVETLFWQNRQASSSGSGASDSFAGVTNLSGLLYFPTGNINFNGNPTVASPCFQMIAWTLNIGGGPTVTANGCLAGYKKIPPPSVLTE